MNTTYVKKRGWIFVLTLSLLLAALPAAYSNAQDENFTVSATGPATPDGEPSADPATDPASHADNNPQGGPATDAAFRTDSTGGRPESGVTSGGAAGIPASGVTSGAITTAGLLPASTYGAFAPSSAATMYLPNTDIIRIQSVRPYLDPAKPMVALTFDDGPSQYTERIVALLNKYNCRATFCVLGNRVKPQIERARAIAAQGSEIVGHSWDHKKLTNLSKKKMRLELSKTNNVIESVTGVKPVMYRPPYGASDKKLRKVSKKQRLALLTWSVDTIDWKLLDAKKVFKRVQRDAGNDKIILMHDIYETTADAMGQVIPWLEDQGYELVTVSELMYYRGIKIKPGRIYNDGV
jgi:peptidoglycan/xylan/chitin deacetylase (PgdA/CDA1 family)